MSGKVHHEFLVRLVGVGTVFDGTPFNERINAFYSENAISEGGDYIYVFDFEDIPLSKTKLFYSAFGLAVLEKSLFTTSTDSNIPLHVYQLNVN